MTTSTPYFHEHVSRRRNKLRKLPQSRPAPLPRSGPDDNVDFNGKLRYGRPIGFLYLCQDDSGREYTTLRYDTAQGETLYRFEDHRKFRRALKQGRPLVDLNQRSSVVNGHSCDGRRHSCSDVHGSDSTGIVFDPVVAAARYSNQTRSSSSNAQSNTALSSQQHRVSFTPSEERVRQAAGMSAEEFIEDRGALRYLQNTSPIPTQNDATRQDIPKKSRFSLPSSSSSRRERAESRVRPTSQIPTQRAERPESRRRRASATLHEAGPSSRKDRYTQAPLSRSALLSMQMAMSPTTSIRTLPPGYKAVPSVPPSYHSTAASLSSIRRTREIVDGRMSNPTQRPSASRRV